MRKDTRRGVVEGVGITIFGTKENQVIERGEAKQRTATTCKSQPDGRAISEMSGITSAARWVEGKERKVRLQMSGAKGAVGGGAGKGPANAKVRSCKTRKEISRLRSDGSK